jgi:hypothetical protein
MTDHTNSRRRFLQGSLALAAGGLLASSSNAAPATAPVSRPAPPAFDESAYDWTDLKGWASGRGFTDTEGDYDRLPARAKDVVRPAVWNLSKDSTGIYADFDTDAPDIAVRYELLKSNLAMPHMPATGVSGVDLYGRSADTWRWLGVARPAAQRVAQALVTNTDKARRRYRLYWPLYNGVRKLELGLPKGTQPDLVKPTRDGAIVYYGTSIAQGGCASRPGMAFTNILGRRLARPFVNLAFSGNGKMEESVGRFIVEIPKPALYVLDCLPNMTPPEVAERTEPLVAQLRAVNPEVPILFVEDRTQDTAWAVPTAAKLHAQRRANLRAAFDRLTAGGSKRLHYLQGAHLTGDDGEATVDGSHPTDLGMVRYADALEPAIRTALA